eukprot:SAG11_NODE_21095_length_432_cov_1.006006_1_plen_63_part_00
MVLLNLVVPIMHTVLYLSAGTFDPVLDSRSESGSPHNRNLPPRTAGTTQVLKTEDPDSSMSM